MKTVKSLIVNADDLGRTRGINEGIIEAHRKGIVTSATLMVNHPTAAHAVELARNNPFLGVGLHVALTGGPPASDPALIPSLVDDRGQLPAGPEGLAGARPEHVLAEARAQLRKFRELTGRDPTHFDSHHHSHRLPVVYDALAQLAWDTGLPVRAATPAMVERLRSEQIPTTDRFVESFYGEGATLENLLRLLGELPLGTTELMCHPARVDDELRLTSSYSDVRERELEVLMHREVRQAVQAVGIKLVHFGEL